MVDWWIRTGKNVQTIHLRRHAFIRSLALDRDVLYLKYPTTVSYTLIHVFLGVVAVQFAVGLECMARGESCMN